jgi:16S rRNA (uracil1498-N3)-methyltransferase
MNRMHTDKHIFSLYYEELSGDNGQHNTLIVADKQLCQRIVSILRLQPGEEIVLFNNMWNVVCHIEALESKSRIRMRVQQFKKNVPFMPSITFALPLLKRDDFEAALYALVEQGVNTIQLIHTHKAGRSWGGSKELERVNRIVIAAAEQSKNYAFPVVHEPILFTDFISRYASGTSCNIYFDPAGHPLLTMIETVKSMRLDQSFVLCVGPEGGLTAQEKDLLTHNGFAMCALTPTILRAVQAASLSAGIFRSIMV